MRIVIAAPPKTGNAWLKCLLATIYDLHWLPGPESPPTNDFASFKTWAEAGNFPDNAIYHQHYDYSPELSAFAASIPAHLATILRDPYDQFVSLYFFVQVQAENPNRAAKGRTRPADTMIGKPIDHPVTLTYLRDEYGSDLAKGLAWLRGGDSTAVRYEALHADPVTELTRATAAIAPVATEKIERAITACEASTLLANRKGLKRRIRSATVGDWRNHLTAEHLEIFRVQHAALIRALGYDVH